MAHQLTIALHRVLKETFTLYLANHHHHWNVEGDRFIALHELFESQYKEQFDALDEIAERIRTLGDKVDNVHTGLSVSYTVEKSDATATSLAMITQLIELNQRVIDEAKRALQVASDHHDPVTEDLMISRISTHEKTVWMLKSLTK